MYSSYYGMSCNPFLKDESIKYIYSSCDYIECINRFNYLKELRGIGLFIGESGYGKTYVIRSFINTLNKDLYKVIYISASRDMTVFDFYKEISDKLDLGIGGCYKIDLYNNIQKEIKRLFIKDKVQPVVIIDDAHLLSREVLLNMKVLYDYEMDSKDYITLILIGQTELKDEIKKLIHISLKQRIIVNYTFKGLSREEVKEYIKTRLKLANVNNEIFNIEAINALYSSSKSSPRRLNTLVTNSLMLGCQNEAKIIDEEIVMNALKEMEI